MRRPARKIEVVRARTNPVPAVLWLVLLGIVPPAAPLVAANAPQAPAPSRTTTIAADSLLASGREALWGGDSPRAAVLLRAYLAVHPRDQAARIDHARACAWSNDYRGALDSYAEAIRLAGPGLSRNDAGPTPSGDTAPHVPPDEIRVQAFAGMADVLDWMGRPAEARRYRWRAAKARPADTELRTKAESADADAEAFARDVTRFTSDSNRLEMWSSRLSLDAGEAADGLWLLHFDHTRLHAVPQHLRAEEYGFSFGRRQLVGPGTMAEGVLRINTPGAASPVKGEGNAGVGVSATVTHRFVSGPSLSLALSEGERWVELVTLRGHAEGLRGFDATLTGYNAFGPRLGLWGRLRLGGLSDGNRFAALDVSGDWQATPAASFGIGVQGADYTTESDDYYTAQRELSLLASARAERALSERATVRASAGAGYGTNRHGSGPLFRGLVSADIAEIGPLSFAGTFEYSESIQTSTYIARAWTAMLRLN
jgi:hypothetical protein